MLNEDTKDAAGIEEILERNFVELDQSRVAELKNLLTLREIKIKHLAREAERLEKKHGKDSVIAKNAAEKKAFSADLAVELGRETRYAEVPTPEVTENVWIVHGFVENADRKPVPGVIVRLFENNRPVSKYKAETDEKGYFSLKIDKLQGLPQIMQLGVAPSVLSEKNLSPAGGQVDSVMIIIKDEKILETPSSTTGSKPEMPDLRFLGWIVTGRIVDAAGSGLAGLSVQVFDKDLLSDDFLDETTTNADGVYRATFTAEKFSDFGMEEYPELYLVIKDAAGRKLFDGKKAAHNSAGRIELMDIKLEKF